MHSNIDSIIIDYLSNELSDENRLKFEALKNNSKELQDYYDGVKKEWDGETNYDHNYNVEKAISTFKSRTSQSKGKNASLQFYLKIAASVILIFSLSYFGYIVGVNSMAKGISTVSCEAGDKANVLLPDGSVVHLNSQSSISYSSDFIKGKRDVELVGEATFKVQSDKRHPFSVNAQGVNVVATGTVFNVMAYPNDAIVRMALVEGILNVTKGNQERALLAGDVVTYDKTRNLLHRNKHLSAKKTVAWQSSEIVFENELLSQVVNQIQRYYNVRIQLDESIESKRFSGVIHTETIDELLIILKNTLGIDVEKKNELIYLNQRKSAS